MTIRPATHIDIEFVLQLTRDFVVSYELDDAAFCVSYLALLEQQSVYFAVAEDYGKIVGFVHGSVHLTLYANGPVGWVDEIMVEESGRRHGVGAQLLGAFEEWARSRGAVLSTLATRRAAPFYLALGYKETAAYFKKPL